MVRQEKDHLMRNKILFFFHFLNFIFYFYFLVFESSHGKIRPKPVEKTRVYTNACNIII